jgi:hypothetical protein
VSSPLLLCSSTSGAANPACVPRPLGPAGTVHIRAVASPDPDASKLDVGDHAQMNTSLQGLTLVHFSAQRKHILLDTLGAWVSRSLSNRETRGGVTKTAQVELISERV